MLDSIYCAKVTATGGRHGVIRSDDGLLDLKLALPKTLGGKGDATNPEQLFAGGYAACFENALLHVSREARHHLPMATSKLSPRLASAATTRVGLCCPPRSP